MQLLHLRQALLLHVVHFDTETIALLFHDIRQTHILSIWVLH